MMSCFNQCPEKLSLLFFKLCVFLSIAFFTSTGKSIAQNEIDSLLQELAKSRRDTTQVWILRDLAYYHLEDNLDSTLFYSQKGHDLARDLGFPQGQIWNLYQKALALEFGDQFEESIATFQTAYNIAVVHKDTLSMAKLRNAMGVAYYYQSEYGHSIAYYHEALNLSEEAKYLEGASHALNNLGVIYRHRRDFKKALDVYQRSLAIKLSQNDTVGLVNAHYNLGLLYSYIQKFQESLEEFSQAQRLNFKQYEDRSLPEINVGLGVAYYNLEEYDSAYHYLTKGIENLKSDKVHEKAGALAYLGILEIKLGNAHSGMQKLLEAQNMVQYTERLELQRQVLKELAVAYEILDQPEKSVDAWKAYTAVNDSINTEQKLWAIEEMQARYEAIEKDKRIQLQELELAKEKNKKRRLSIWLTCTFLTSLGVIYYYISQWRKRVKTKELELSLKFNGAVIDFDKINRKLLSPLTKREKEIIGLVDKGLSNHEIAEKLFVSDNTVKTHLKNIFSKTEAVNRTDLLHKLRQH